MSEDPSGRTFADVVAARISRRGFLAGTAAGALAALGRAVDPASASPLTFSPIAVSTDDAIRVPPGYEATVLLRWGDPVGAPAGAPEFRADGSGSAADQMLQAGMHHDGMYFFPLPYGTPASAASSRGLLALNHEYLDDGLLFPDGQKTWTAAKVDKAQAAVGVSVVEVARAADGWRVVRPSPYARRITARTPCRVSGPAAGHRLLRTAADPGGRQVLGTYAGCANGWTPWGTYITCEENWQTAFVHAGPIPRELQRYRITATGLSFRWAEFDRRFDAQAHPNEPNRFGWAVEIDPYDASSAPVKRTALGRLAREGAACAVGPDRRLAFYMGDDSELEHVYKFVTARPYDPARREANRDLLDDGTLHAARFDADGTGQWLPLVHGQGPLTAANGFADQGDVVVHARMAADLLDATKMDRPEWIMPHPDRREVYCACTGSAARGRDGQEGPNPANRRAPNPFGHLVRWREDGGDPAAARFRWDVFTQAGPAERGGTISGDVFACPDGLWVDGRGVLWVETDISPRSLGTGDFAPLGNNALLAVDPATGAFKRFLTGPRGCEITGFLTTPDNRTAFVNIQHPGEVPGDRSDPGAPRARSNWPDFQPDSRPRSATVVIRRTDGGLIGT